MDIYNFAKLSKKKKSHKIIFLLRKIQIELIILNLLNKRLKNINNEMYNYNFKILIENYNINFNKNKTNIDSEILKDLKKVILYIETYNKSHFKDKTFIPRYKFLYELEKEFKQNKKEQVKNHQKYLKIKISEISKLIFFLKENSGQSIIENDFEKFFDYGLNLRNSKFKHLDKNFFSRKNGVLLCEIRSPFNAGSIIRTAEAFGFEKVYLYGISSKLNFKKISKTSKFSENFIEIIKITDSQLKDLKQKYYFIGLEKTIDALCINKLNKEYLKNSKEYLIIMGNEEFGISEKLFNYIDLFIQIPMIGIKNSINVSNAFAIAAYKLLELTINN